MAGPALARARLLRAPGVPRLAGVDIRSAASRKLPRKRRSNSGQPRSHRTLARRVAVWPADSPVTLMAILLAPISPRDVARTCNDRLLLKPVFSSEERS